MYWPLIVFVWFVMGCVCCGIAACKNRSIVGWFVLGILFGIFALLVIICLSSVKPEEEVKIEEKPQRDSSPNKYGSNKYDELRNLKSLLDDKIITQEEYEQIKKNIIEKS